MSANYSKQTGEIFATTLKQLHSFSGNNSTTSQLQQKLSNTCPQLYSFSGNKSCQTKLSCSRNFHQNKTFAAAKAISPEKRGHENREINFPKPGALHQRMRSLATCGASTEQTLRKQPHLNPMPSQEPSRQRSREEGKNQAPTNTLSQQVANAFHGEPAAN